MPDVAVDDVPVDVPMPGEGDTGTEIARRVEQYPVAVMPLMEDGEIRAAWRTANALVASRMFKGVEQAEQAFAKILIGRDLGLSAAQSMMGLDLVEGSIQMRGTLLLAWVRKSQQYDYRIIELVGDHDDPDEANQRCTLRFFEVAEDGTKEALTPDITFRVAQAYEFKSFKPNMPWFNARRNMLLWRAASDGVKFHCPDLLGGMPVYTEADDLTPQTALVAGTGDGAPQGLVLPPAVEAVLARATALGHAGLADRATAEMALSDQPDDFVARWVADATADLDALDALGSPPVEDVVATPLLADDLRRQADELNDAADRAEAEGKSDQIVDDLRLEAEGFMADAERAEAVEAEAGAVDAP